MVLSVETFGDKPVQRLQDVLLGVFRDLILSLLSSKQGMDKRSIFVTCSILSQTTSAGITLVTAYSGMRLEEICNLRNEEYSGG